MIFDDFLPLPYAREICVAMSDHNFDWHYMDRTIYDTESNGCITNELYRDTPYFQHVICKNAHTSRMFELFRPMFYFFEYRTGYQIKNVIRVVSNLMLPTEDNVFGVIHVDASSNVPEKIKTMLYYVNDSDGVTTIFNEKFSNEKVLNPTVRESYDPKFNRSIVFNSDQYHCSCTPSKVRRMVINFIFEIV